jgi:hypothetical protein
VDREGFARFLRSHGKKPHVIEGLIRQVEQFERYLERECQGTLDTAQAQDLRTYVSSLHPQGPGRASIGVRGIALYYRFSGNPELASLATAIREEGTAKTRKAYLLRDFRGVNPVDLSRLESIGITNVEHMLAAGKTPGARQQIADQAGLAPDVILELVKLSDLSRVEGLKGIRARLYYDAGADTLDKIARWQPEDLRQMLAEFVTRTAFEGIPPLPKEVLHTVTTARLLPRIVEY